MEIVRFVKKDEKIWEDFIRNSVNGTIFHTRKFLSYHPEDRFIDHSLVFHKKEHVFALITGIEKVIEGKKTFISHQGASYGGFIFNKCSISDSRDLIKSFLKYLKSNNFKRAVITNPPKIYYKEFTDYIDFSMLGNGFKFIKREISSYLALPENFNFAFRQFTSPTRTSIRKSQKEGVIVKESNDYETFYKILERNLGMRHNVKPTHTLKELLNLKDMFPEYIKLFAAYHKNTMIGGIVTFECNPLVNLAFYISGNMDYQYLRPVDLLMWEIIRFSINKRYKYLDFGLFTVNMEPNFGLGKFKEKFGAIGIFRDTFGKNL